MRDRIEENPIMKMINYIDAERKMQSNHSNQMDDAIPIEYPQISKFRRKGTFKEREDSAALILESSLLLKVFTNSVIH